MPVKSHDAPPSARVSSNGRVKKPLTFRRLLIRRIAIIIPLSFIAIIVSKMGWLERAADTMQFDRLAWFDNTKLVEHLRILVTHNGMTTLPGRCLIPIINGNDPLNATRIDFMAKASQGCPGIDGSFGKLFTLKVDRPDRRILSDAGSPGHFYLIPSS